MSRFLSCVLISLSVLASGDALAHRAWLLPSATVLSAPGDWVTVDAAVSNELFYFNHVPLRLDNLQISGPDGASVAPQHLSTGKFRSTFDVELSSSGTYRIAVINAGVMATYKVNGEAKRWRGNAADFAKQVPADAQDLQVSEMDARVETFVTAGKPTTAGLTPTGKGLEFAPATHPNDLFAGETARFKFLIDGKPASNLALTIITDGSRYRDQVNEIQLTTDADGQIAFAFPEPGMYWINASTQDARTQLKQARERRLSYTATLEVMAQ